MKGQRHASLLGFVYLLCLLFLFAIPLPGWAAPATSWTPQKLSQTIEVGGEQNLGFTFSSSVKLNNAELWVVPKLQRFVTVEPRAFSLINAKTRYTVTIRISIPRETQVGLYEGTIHLKVGSRTYPLPLAVELNVVSTANRPPVAAAAPRQDVAVGNPVALDGSGSYDPDGNLITYLWTLEGRPPESTATISNSESITPSFTPDLPGDYLISLFVHDGIAASEPDFVSIHAYSANAPPTANAGSDQHVATQTTVYLSGAASTDPDGEPLTYQWMLISKPGGSAAQLDRASSVNTSFHADLAGEYWVQLVVSDGIAFSSPDEVIITAETPNAAPTADAGDDQTVSRNTEILLDGTGSHDPEGDPLTYHWSIVSSPPRK